MLHEETASVKDLLRWLSTKPLLWIGAGISVAAGYPSTDDLVKELCEAMPDRADCAASVFTVVVDRYKDRFGEQGLAYFLNAKIGVTKQPVAIHTYVADLASERHIASIYTTNYDDLIDRSLRNEGVHIMTQAGEENLGLARTNPESDTKQDFFLVSKIHGDGQAWKKAVLSGQSYEDYYKNHPWMREQITRALSDHCVIFLGCSLKDPRLLSWLQDLRDDEVKQLNPWMCMMSRASWKRLEGYQWNGIEAKLLLNRANITIALFDDHSRLPAIWSDAVKELCPRKPRRAFLPDEWEEVIKLRKLTRVWIINKIAEDPIRMSVSGWNLDKRSESMPRWAMRYHQPSMAFDLVTARYRFHYFQHLPEANDRKMDWEETNFVNLDAIPGRYVFEFSSEPVTKKFLLFPYESVRYTLRFKSFVPWDLLIEAGDYKASISDEIAERFRKDGVMV